MLCSWQCWETHTYFRKLSGLLIMYYSFVLCAQRQGMSVTANRILKCEYPIGLLVSAIRLQIEDRFFYSIGFWASFTLWKRIRWFWNLLFFFSIYCYESYFTWFDIVVLILRVVVFYDENGTIRYDEHELDYRYPFKGFVSSRKGKLYCRIFYLLLCKVT